MPFRHRRISIAALIMTAVTTAVATATVAPSSALPNWLSAAGAKTAGTVTFDGNAWSAISMGASSARIEIRTKATAAQFTTAKRKVRVAPGRDVHLTVPAGQVFYITPLAGGAISFTVRGVELFATISGSGTVQLTGRGKYQTSIHQAARAWPKAPVVIAAVTPSGHAFNRRPAGMVGKP